MTYTSSVREKPPTHPDDIDDTASPSAAPDPLFGLSRLNDTVVDVRSPLARPAPVPAAPSAGRPPARPTSEPKLGALPTPTAPKHQAAVRPTAPRTPATEPERSAAPDSNRGGGQRPPTLDGVIAERDKALKMVAAREGILQVVAHDLRNPLNLVKVGGSLLTRMVRANAGSEDAGIDPARITQVADTLVIAVRRMERLISDLLDLEALDKGALRLVRGPANAGLIIDEVVVEMRAKASEKGVEILAEKPRHPVIIDCDKDRIAQILENLLGNAIRFTPTGKHIVVRLREQQGEARFEVADEGPGIADQDLPRIFDSYYRAEVPQGRGLGLGLSIVLGLVRAHDGAIWAESQHGHGATFVFTMPRRDVKRDTMVELPAIKLPMPVRKG